MLDLEISLRFGAMWNCCSLDFVYWKEEAPLVLEKECFERLVTLLGRFRGMPVRAIACNLCLRPTSMALIVASHPLVFSSSRHAHDPLLEKRDAFFLAKIARFREETKASRPLLWSCSFLNIKFARLNNRHARARVCKYCWM